MNDHEYVVVQAMLQFGGSFIRSLANCFHAADDNNVKRLREAFPEYWKEYEEMAEDIKRKALV